MRRFIDEELRRWKEGELRKPLILRGARQIGKIWSLKEFGKSQFESLALVDLERNPPLRRLFDGDLGAAHICADLEVLLRQKITPGKTLLFFDEIQACPRAITALYYFYEEMPDLHVVGAGSLLEFALKDASFPVGRIQSCPCGAQNSQRRARRFAAGGERFGQDIQGSVAGRGADAISCRHAG